MNVFAFASYFWQSIIFPVVITLKESCIGRFYTRGRIIRVDELGQTVIVRLVIRR